MIPMNGSTVSFFAPGRPATKGSTRSFMSKAGRLVTTHDNPRTKSWQGVVACAAQQAGVERCDGGVIVRCEFRFARPKGHSGTRGLKPSAPRYPTSRAIGDTDKLVRACLDALTGILYADDSQVVDARGMKRWCNPGEPEGALVTVEAL